MKYKSLVIIGINLVLSLFCSCQVEERKTTRNDVALPPMQDFPFDSNASQSNGISSLNFVNNKWFLWRYPLTPEVSQLVVSSGEQIDKKEDEGVKVRESLKKIESDLTGANAQLNDKASVLEKEAQENLGKLTELQDQKARLTPEDGNEMDEELAHQIAELETKLGELPGDVKTAKAARDEFYKNLNEQITKKYNIDQEGMKLVTTVINNTDYFQNGPDNVSFTAQPGGAIAVLIRNWPNSGDEQSTENGHILNVSYEPKGGVFRFDVETKPHEEFYRFRLSRSRLYIKDGRSFMQGDLDHYIGDVRGANTLERHGVAKSSSSNN